MGQTSEGARKAAKTRKRKYGRNHFKRVGAARAKSRTPSYFAKLKAEDPEKLREISREAAKKGTPYFKKLKEENPEKFKEISAKGGRSGKLPNGVRGNRSKKGVSEE